MVYILKNLNLRKFFISFMICFIFIIIGITHVFADEKAKITQVVMDKDVGARLDEGDSVKISVKAEGATAVHAWLVNRNQSQMGKIMAAMVIVGCLAVIYIVRKRELYEK